MKNETKEDNAGKEIIFKFAGAETKGEIVEVNPESPSSIEYVYKAVDKKGFKYFIQKKDIISIR